ncbi:hypothetical protein ACHAWO_007356 [Cyclotella atomus]|uniref:Uncharacterized protein n=1 Tax=Cyclotella atomus TaxID=382360 RepID=A0ABD3NS97_9STRA
MNASSNSANPGPDRPALGTRREATSHPSSGGSKGYSPEMREQVITMWLNGNDLDAAWLVPLRHQKKFPCLKTCKNWINQYQREGHVRPKRQTGNHVKFTGNTLSIWHFIE